MAQDSRFFEIAGLVTSIAGVIVIAMSSRKGSSSSSSGGEGTPEAPPARPDRWLDPGQSFLLLGDSIGVGIQKALNELSKSYGTTLTSMVKIGSTAGYWSRHVEPGDAGYPVIILSLGSNDAALADLDAEGPDICNLVAQLSERGAHILWFLPPSFRKDALTAKQARFAELLLQCGAIQLDLLGPQPSVASDHDMHLHLTPDGYRVLAAQIFDALTRHDGLPEGEPPLGSHPWKSATTAAPTTCPLASNHATASTSLRASDWCGWRWRGRVTNSGSICSTTR